MSFLRLANTAGENKFHYALSYGASILVEPSRKSTDVHCTTYWTGPRIRVMKQAGE